MASPDSKDLLARLKGIRAQVDGRLRGTRPVAAALGAGIDRKTYVAYLSRVASQYAPHSPEVMSLAAGRCITSRPALGVYLLRHAADERGHNEWAADDLRDLKVTRAAAAAARPVPACAALIGYTHFLAARGNPVGLYGWMYVLEAVGADLGADVARALKRGDHGLPARFVGGHGAADRKHIKEIEDQIARHVTDPADQADVVEAAEVTADLYVRMFEQLAE